MRYLIAFEAEIHVDVDDANGPPTEAEAIQAVQDVIGHTGAVVTDFLTIDDT